MKVISDTSRNRQPPFFVDSDAYRSNHGKPPSLLRSVGQSHLVKIFYHEHSHLLQIRLLAPVQPAWEPGRVGPDSGKAANEVTGIMAASPGPSMNIRNKYPAVG